MSKSDRPGVTGPESVPDSPSLDSHADNPTRWEKRLSGSCGADSETAEDTESENWDSQQKRVFHRVNTLLHYWESRDYEILWVTLTSSPESDGADKLAYNLQRLRQTIERARLAYDSDGEGHELTHIDELEQLCIRTSEGPEGKGVLHLFWAWKPHEGQHSRNLFIPQNWLAYQWGRIHGPYDEHSEKAVEPLYVWIEKYGQGDYHSKENVARYCVTQYLGEHAEALEHCSWSHGRTLGGGSVTETWRAVRSRTETLERAVEVWEEVIAGESVALGSNSDHIDHTLKIRPPPNLGFESGEVTVIPPDDYQPPGPSVSTFTTTAPAIPEHDGDSRECPECGSRCGIHELSESHHRVVEDATDRVAYVCASCKVEFAEVGEGGAVVVESEFEGENWAAPSAELSLRQARLWEFVESWSPSLWGVQESESGSELGSDSGRDTAPILGRDREHEPVVVEDGFDRERVREYVRTHQDVSAVEVMGRLSVGPEHRSVVEQIVE